ncbi:hypothetical protein QUA56_33645 [Microcoleus sp. N3A4]
MMRRNNAPKNGRRLGDRDFLEFQELVARCPKYFSELPAPPIEAATQKIS